MKVTREKEENCQVFLTIELEPTEVEEALEQSYKRLAKRANIPGFRKGKAPRAVLERHLGKDRLLEDALNELLPQVYEKALKDEGIEAVASPSIEVTQTEPVVFKATVPLKPTITLGDYHSLKLKAEPATVKNEEVEAVIEQLRRQHGTWEPVERAADFDDLVTMDVEGYVEEKPLVSQQGVQYQLLKDQPVPVPGFAEELVGMKGGEDKEFKLQLPQDYPRAEVAGKEARFKVKVAEIKQQRLPELNKEFVQAVNPELKTVASLRKQLSANLIIRAEQKAKEEFEEKVIDAVVDLSQVAFPPVLVDAEVERLLEQQTRWLQAGGGGMEEYLSRVGKTEKEIREELRSLATKRVSRSLVLGQFAEEAKIKITDAEINAELESIVQSAGGDKDEMRKRLDASQARLSVEQILTTRKAIQQLVEIAGGRKGAGKKK